MQLVGCRPTFQLNTDKVPCTPGVIINEDIEEQKRLEQRKMERAKAVKEKNRNTITSGIFKLIFRLPFVPFFFLLDIIVNGFSVIGNLKFKKILLFPLIITGIYFMILFYHMITAMVFTNTNYLLLALSEVLIIYLATFGFLLFLKISCKYLSWALPHSFIDKTLEIWADVQHAKTGIEFKSYPGDREIAERYTGNKKSACFYAKNAEWEISGSYPKEFFFGHYKPGTRFDSYFKKH